MVKKSSKQDSIKDRVLDAALTLAAEFDWQDVGYDEILEKAGVSKDEAIEYYDCKTDILVAYGRRIDHQMMAAISHLDSEMSVRERLFEIIMERFDLVNNDRDAVLSILRSMKFDPKQALISMPHLGKSMALILDAAGENTSGIQGMVKVAGMKGVYLYALKSWKEDESEDLSKTMAALDKALNMAEELANTCENKDFLGGLMSFGSRFKKQD
ncbi:MAG: TetR family transcriptional regulator [Pseudomonadota bacterium]